MMIRMGHVAGVLAAWGLAAPVLADMPGGVAPEYLARDWQLRAIDGQAFAARASLDLSTQGRVTGQAPCNRFSAVLTGDLPAFRPGPIVATRMACADLAAEAAFLAALAAMTGAEVDEAGALVLSGPDGRRMVFTRP